MPGVWDVPCLDSRGIWLANPKRCTYSGLRYLSKRWLHSFDVHITG